MERLRLYCFHSLNVCLIPIWTMDRLSLSCSFLTGCLTPVYKMERPKQRFSYSWYVAFECECDKEWKKTMFNTLSCFLCANANANASDNVNVVNALVHIPISANVNENAIELTKTDAPSQYGSKKTISHSQLYSHSYTACCMVHTACKES